MGRAPCCDKDNVKKGPWSPEEDAKLKAYIEQRGTGGNWIALPHKIGLKRCGKSCRLRWLNYLRPNIKHGGFSEEEDNIICSLYISIGSRWSVIAAQLPGRTDNDVKNYWNTRLKKKLLGQRKELQSPHLINIDHEPKDDPKFPALISSALERIQLHLQLQGSQNLLSFDKNPALWPNYFHAAREGTNKTQFASPDVSSTQQASLGSTQECQNSEFDSSKPLVQPIHEEFQNSSNRLSPSLNPIAYAEGSSSIDVTSISNSIGGDPMVAGFQSELNELLNKETAIYAEKEDQLNEFNCFKEMSGEKDGMKWWATDLDMTLSASNSWDSASFFEAEGMFEEYETGFDT